MIRLPLGFLLTLLIPATASAQAAQRVRIETSLGVITVEVDVKRAPITARNFLAYVDGRRFDGTSFYRAARTKYDATKGLVQGGIDGKAIRAAGWPIKHEPTSLTGLKHGDATLSMARNAPGTAMGDFFITVGPAPYLDATPSSPGYAAFGRVVGGMAVVRRILAMPTWPGGRSRTTMGQYIKQPVRILSARRAG